MYFCGNTPADVVFLLDNSNSIWYPDFLKQVQFVRDVVSMFQIGENMTRIGVATYSNKVNTEFYLDEYYDSSDLLKALRTVSYGSGDETDTASAIKHMRKELFSPSHGSRSNHEVSKIGIILTDGRSKKIIRTVFESLRAQKKGIHMFAIGIGTNTHSLELNAIASQPKEEYMFEVYNYEALDSIKEKLAVRTCRGEI